MSDFSFENYDSLLLTYFGHKLGKIYKYDPAHCERYGYQNFIGFLRNISIEGKRMKNRAKNLLVMAGLKGPALWFRAKTLRLIGYPKWASLKNRDCIKLELGSGPKKGSNGWTTVDISGADIDHDLRMGIPLPDESVDWIYTSHMFEHIPYRELVVFIKECFRVLKKGGELSVCVPDASLYIKSYVNGTIFRDDTRTYAPAVVNTGSLLDQVNYIAYMDGHHSYMFDRENLVNTLKKSPFRDVRARDFDETLDLETRVFESVYAVAIK